MKRAEEEGDRGMERKSTGGGGNTLSEGERKRMTTGVN